MTPQLLLDAFRRLLREQPPLDGRGAYGTEQHQWLGRASALVAEWHPLQASSFRVEARAMAGNLNRQMNYGAVLTTIHEAISSIENSLPSQPGQVFGPGAVYDFFRALNELVESATRSIFIIDTYMDNGIFDSYLSNLRQGVEARLLVSRYVESVKVAAEMFRKQRTTSVEVRRSSELHDRVIFVDGSQCWVLGASIKDAAAHKPTYLAPLSGDVVVEKLRIYEGLWSTAIAI